MPEAQLNSAQWKELEFAVAAKLWLELKREKGKSDKTLHEYQLNVNTLLKFFKPYKLTEITSETIAEYQKKRKAEGIGYSQLSHEGSVIQQLLRLGGLWEEIQPFYSPPRKPKWKPGRVLPEADQERLLRHAQSNPNWEAAFYFADISLNTSCGPGEVASLRLMDLRIHEKIPVFNVNEEGAKNHERLRPVALNEEALKAVKMALARANRLGATEPEHYLFPYRNKRTKKYDPTRHQGEFKWAWKKVCDAAGLSGLKMYDLRRTWITDKLNDPNVAVETIIKQCGHIGYQVLKHYSYRRLEKMHQMVSRDDKPKPRKKPVERVLVEPSRGTEKAESQGGARWEIFNPQSFTVAKYWKPS